MKGQHETRYALADLDQGQVKLGGVSRDLQCRMELRLSISSAAVCFGVYQSSLV